MEMKKILAVFAVFILGMGSFAHAHVQSLWIDADVNAEIPMNDDLDTTLYISGSLGYDINLYVAIYIEAGWREFDFSDIDADVTSVPLLLNIRYTFAPDAQWSPYVFGGLGMSLNDINASDADIDDSFAGQVGGGAEYYVNESLAVFTEVRIFLTDPDTSEPLLGHESLDLNSISVGGGVRYDF
jgi:opacity protein-like surface antigen